MTVKNDNNKADTLDGALTQFVNAYVRGEQPDIDQFVEQYLQHEARIRRRIGSLHEIDALFDSIVKTDADDFEEAARERDLVGQTIGNFEIIEMIGRGGMGVVYLARDTRLKRSVAVKSMPANLAGDSTTRMRFRREAELLASLNHSNIAVIYEIVEQDKSGYLILEYVPGETLTQRMAREPLKLDEALSIGRQIAEAISAAHKKGIVHRDLKPGNIKITPDGQVKVLDFGLAKVPTGEGMSSDITVTQSGHVIGTPAYMSPEQARGNEADHRTDIWSYGCILYQMLTGQLPFEGQTATDTLARIIEREPDWKLLPEETPANIRTLLRRCLEKDPNKRLDNITDAIVQVSDTLSKPLTVPAVSTTLPRVMWILGATIIIILLAVVLRLLPENRAQPSSKGMRLVVLPFENLGIVEDESSSDVITEAITSRLVGISGLNIISRRSVIKYKNKEIDTQQIAEELGVDYVLEGAVQQGQSSDPNSHPQRMAVQLVRASDDTEIWAKIYDVDVSRFFQIESDITGHVVQALNITLVEPERRVLESRPTENAAAYAYYIRGNYYHNRSFYQSDWEIAIQMYEEAIGLDPEFALAYARLSWVHSHMYWHALDRSPERLVLAEQAARKALELDPDLSEGHLALGFYHYWGHHDYNNALEEFAIVQKSRPNDGELLFSIGLVQRRQGKLDQALANIKKASELDPLWHVAALEVGFTLLFLRRYSECEHYYDLAISLAPDWATAYSYKVWLYEQWHGHTQQARAVVEEGIKSTGETFNGTLTDLDVYDGNYQQALERLSLKTGGVNNQFRFIPLTLQYAMVYGYMKEEELAKKHYDEARIILEAKVAEDPEDERFHSALGIIYAGLGEEQKAIKHGKRAVDLLPVSKDAVRGPSRHTDLARIYVMLDKYDDAINELEYLLSIPSQLSIPRLKNDPAWAALREHPRFQKLLKSNK